MVCSMAALRPLIRHAGNNAWEELRTNEYNIAYLASSKKNAGDQNVSILRRLYYYIYARVLRKTTSIMVVVVVAEWQCFCLSYIHSGCVPYNIQQLRVQFTIVVIRVVKWDSRSRIDESYICITTFKIINIGSGNLI